MAQDGEGKAGCRFLRKVLDKHDEAGQLRVNFVQSIMDFEDRFMAEEDKNFLLRILKSLARGNLVQVQMVVPKSKMTSAAASTASSAKQDQ